MVKITVYKKESKIGEDHDSLFSVDDDEMKEPTKNMVCPKS